MRISREGNVFALDNVSYLPFPSPTGLRRLPRFHPHESSRRGCDQPARLPPGS